MVLESPFEIAVPPGEFRQMVHDSIRGREDQIFLIDGMTGTEVTYGALTQKASSIAVFLNRIGVGDGTHVAMMTDVTVEANLFFTGLLLSGATPCPMNPVLKPDDIRQLLEICGAKVVYCESRYLENLEAALEDSEDMVIVTDIEHSTYMYSGDMMEENISDFQVPSVDADENIAFILFTSGTTGVPKGVMISSNSAKITTFKLAHMETDIFISTSPLYWISYIGIITYMLINGRTLVIPRTKYIPGTNAVDLTHILACVEKYKADNWFAGPSMLLEMSGVPECWEYDLSSLRQVAFGGSHLLADQRRGICDALFDGRNILMNMYGATEVGIISQWPKGYAPDHDSPRAASVGQLIAGCSLKVLDSSGKELGPGEIGEFVIRSSSIMKGYVNKDMPRRYDPGDWYHLGDLGHYDEDGYMYFSSRLKEVMKFRGLQIAPAELENVIVQHPGVAEVCVVGRPHEIDGEHPAAFVVPKDSDLTQEELIDFVHERVIDAKKLRGGLFFVDGIPKSGVGKVLRRELLETLKEMEEGGA